MMVLSAEDFIKFLLHMQNSGYNFGQVIVPCKNGTDAGTFKIITSALKEKISLDSYRSEFPAKYLFYFPREKVYPAKTAFPKRILAGLKACDLKALEILDKALLHSGFIDPLYQGWRENTTVISSDCGEISKNCSCNLFGGKPFADNGFDLNISRLDDNYLITVGSSKGEKLLQLLYKETELKDAGSEFHDNLENKRNEITARLNKQNSLFPGSIDFSSLRKVEMKNWLDESKECVGCGACTSVCPTCYCLILNDNSANSQFVKMRSYDSCQWYGYARVAGGGTPRPKMHERFRNRYLCKLDYMSHNFGNPGCTGCGRCTEACTAGIDFKKVIFELSKKENKKELVPEMQI